MITQPTETLQEADIRALIARHAGADRVPTRFKIITDTSDFFKIEYNDVVLLGDVPYWMKRYEKEGRFGLDDEPKFWVRRAIELTTGATRILKLVFFEEFQTVIAGVKMTCFRSPKKEARLLDLVADHKNFMHGRWVLDAAGNNVRILEFIRGPRFDDVVAGYGSDHHDYFYNHFPRVLDHFIELVQSIKFLHDQGEKHGDIRRDHIIWDEERQVNRWIDFDYNFQQGESLFSFDMQGLGNILIFLVGRGDVLVPDLYHNQRALFDTLWGEDLSIAYKNRVANLQKIYPYIPDSLNRILLHFSQGTNFFYENTDQMLEDLNLARADIVALTEAIMSEKKFGDLARRDTERHLLLAVDESENSKRAVMYVADFFSGNPDIFVTILSIIPEPSDDLFPTEDKRQQWIAEQKTTMDKALAVYRQILIGAGLKEEQIENRLIIRRCTSIGDAILEEQAKLRCCIVVVGRRGLTHNEEFLFGSTSSKILHHATHCAVMVVE